MAIQKRQGFENVGKIPYKKANLYALHNLAFTHFHNLKILLHIEEWKFCMHNHIKGLYKNGDYFNFA